MIDFDPEADSGETEETEPETVQEEGIPRFEWEHAKLGKFWVEFEDPQLLSGKHIDLLRTALGSSENNGTAANAFMTLAAQLLVKAWEIPTVKGGARLPKHDKKHEWRSQVPGGFMVKMELHMSPYLEFLTKAGAKKAEVAEGEPGSPLLPVNE